MLVTSGYDFEGYKILEYLGFCSGECALGTGFLSSLGAGFADVFGTTSSKYQEKLLHARKYAMSALEKNAKQLGANAIIGVDVDYTTFTSDIMGVIASGTAVRVDKSLISQNEDCIIYPIISYYENAEINTINLHYNENSNQIFLELCIYNDKKVTALNVDIIANTIFGIKYEFSDISFINIHKKDNFSKTETVLLKIPYEKRKAVESFSVKINCFISEGKVYSCKDNHQISNFSVAKLGEYRKLYGKDVMVDFRGNFDTWTCMCGRQNSDSDKKCGYCGRIYREYNTIQDTCSMNINEKKDVLERILPSLELCSNCQEIRAYLVKEIREGGINLPAKLMMEIEKMCDLEESYGSMKHSAIAKIKMYIITIE